MSKRAVVTGATSGIGRATALELSKRGCELVLTGRRQPLLDEVAEECGGAITVCADIGQLANCQRIAAAATEGLGDSELIVVHSAGIAEFGDFHKTSAESIESQMRTNLMGPIFLTHEVLPTMLASGKGHLVQILSVAAELVLPGSAVYSGSKAGLRMMAKVWAAEYRRKGIRVTSILPGAVDTPIWDAGGPPRKDMIPASVVAEIVADAVMSPPNRSYDEIHLMPPKGIL